MPPRSSWATRPLGWMSSVASRSTPPLGMRPPPSAHASPMQRPHIPPVSHSNKLKTNIHTVSHSLHSTKISNQFAHLSLTLYKSQTNCASVFDCLGRIADRDVAEAAEPEPPRATNGCSCGGVTAPSQSLAPTLVVHACILLFFSETSRRRLASHQQGSRAVA